ncbi:hypothetical protein V6N11_058887 [Hibiscus sabdariffa]|uniref:Uncharacterized protein n=1 Tax=Hibiscus sabdariffa TaxID=183260 RepID=A0ABR2U5J6_9ROSI
MDPNGCPSYPQPRACLLHQNGSAVTTVENAGNNLANNKPDRIFTSPTNVDGFHRKFKQKSGFREYQNKAHQTMLTWLITS